MKPIKKRWLGLSLASTLIAIGAFSTPAMAADYSGNCAFIPNHVTGNATINDSACVIDTGATLIVDGTLTIDADSVDVKSEIQSVGKVTIRTNGGGELKLRKKASSENNDILLQSPQNRIDTKGLEAGNSVQVDAGLNGAEGATWDIKVDGQIIVNKIQSNQNPDLHGNVLLRAAGPISTKTIKTDGDLGTSSVKSGGIQIEAYRSGAAAANGAEFVIGGTGAVNGVNGNIITQSTIGGGTSPSFVNGGVYVTMGGRFNTGNIRVADMTAIKVRATQSRSGFIIFNANGGTIFLPAGNLNTSGDDTNNSGAGLIYLLARTLDTQPGTIISANQTETAAGTGHQIFICVETLKYRGNGTDGLKILNDGNGGAGFFSLVNISPQGYLVPGNLTSNVNQMPWTFSLGSAELAKDGPLTIDGTEGNGQILLRADGNTAAVNVSGYPLAFNGGDVTVRSRGQTLHRINVGFFGTVNGARQGLTVTNVGNWALDANGKAPAGGGAAAGGIIQVKADQTSLTALDSTTDPSSGNIVIRANGADTNGDGGIISVDTKSFVLGATTHAASSADGAPNGTGNAVKNPIDSAGPFAVTLKTGTTNLILGGGNQAIKITATGGGTGGNGGTVLVKPSSGKVKVRNSLAVDTSALSDDSDGGFIALLSPQVTFLGADTTSTIDTALKAKAGADGNGGEITINQTPDQLDVLAVIDGTQNEGTPAIAARQNLGPKKGELIDINVDPCRDYPASSTSWPGSVRLCTPSGLVNPNDKDLAASQTAQDPVFDNLRQIFSDNSVKLYVFSEGSYHNTYFNDLAPNLHGSVTFVPRNPARKNIYVSIWQEGSIGAGVVNYTPVMLREVTAHELGHALDGINDTISSKGDYKAYLARDVYDLDYVAVPNTAFVVRRDPCSLTKYQGNVISQAAPPFQNVVNLSVTDTGFPNGEPVCTTDANGNSVLRPEYGNANNSQILISIEQLWINLQEIHAQTFAFQAVGAQGARPMNDQVLTNSKGDSSVLGTQYFVCLRGWAAAELQGNKQPAQAIVSPTGSCLVAPPAQPPLAP